MIWLKRANSAKIGETSQAIGTLTQELRGVKLGLWRVFPPRKNVTGEKPSSGLAESSLPTHSDSLVSSPLMEGCGSFVHSAVMLSLQQATRHKGIDPSQWDTLGELSPHGMKWSYFGVMSDRHRGGGARRTPAAAGRVLRGDGL